MSEEKPMVFVRRVDATDYLSSEEDIAAFLFEAEKRADGSPDVLSAAQAVVRRARARYGLEEPEPELCQFCGLSVPMPCESLPPDICEKAIAAMRSKDE